MSYFVLVVLYQASLTKVYIIYGFLIRLKVPTLFKWLQLNSRISFSSCPFLVHAEYREMQGAAKRSEDEKNAERRAFAVIYLIEKWDSVYFLLNVSDLRIQFLHPGTRLEDFEEFVGLPGVVQGQPSKQDFYLLAEISVRRILQRAKESRDCRFNVSLY